MDKESMVDDINNILGALLLKLDSQSFNGKLEFHCPADAGLKVEGCSGERYCKDCWAHARYHLRQLLLSNKDGILDAERI
jgi:hypothetical protein